MKDWQVVKLQVEVLNPQEGSSPQEEALNPQGDLLHKGRQHHKGVGKEPMLNSLLS